MSAGAISSCPAYRDFRWPPATALRYVHEDVPYAFVPLVAVAEQIAVATPVMRAPIDLRSAAFGRDYRPEGPGVHLLGIRGLGPSEIVELAASDRPAATRARA